jgi:hypothetical protein
MTKPITPLEAASKKQVPDKVLEAFNELIVERSGVVPQEAVLLRILSAMPDVTRAQIFERGWLNIEEIYSAAGWKVTYDKPAYNENHEASFTFVPKHLAKR